METKKTSKTANIIVRGLHVLLLLVILFAIFSPTQYNVLIYSTLILLHSTIFIIQKKYTRIVYLVLMYMVLLFVKFTFGTIGVMILFTLLGFWFWHIMQKAADNVIDPEEWHVKKARISLNILKKSKKNFLLNKMGTEDDWNEMIKRREEELELWQSTSKNSKEV